MINLYSFIKKILFQFDPEFIHHHFINIAHLKPSLGRILGIRSHSAAHEVRLKNGLTWNSPIGLAAGFDKNAEALDFFHHQGFGAIECGTVTLRQQAGNLRPRIFRYPHEESLRNCMGFPNLGAKIILEALKDYRQKTPVGVNIGKNKNSNKEESIHELAEMVSLFSPFSSYFTVNVSSPNTPGLRDLQDKGYLRELFTTLMNVKPKCENNQKKLESSPSFFLKIAPDINKNLAIEMLELSQELNLSGIIATNTTYIPERGAGGVSGKLLKIPASQIREILLKEKKDDFEIIGVGGFFDFDDLLEFWFQGGKVIQIYTSYIYQGPQVLEHFKKKIDDFIAFQKLSLQEFFDYDLREKQARIRSFREKSK